MDGIVEVLDANAKDRAGQIKSHRHAEPRHYRKGEPRPKKEGRCCALLKAAEREADLARVEAQVKSLRQVEAEQQNIIDKLPSRAYGRVPVEGPRSGSRVRSSRLRRRRRCGLRRRVVAAYRSRKFRRRRRPIRRSA